ncbi:MAG: Gfo/Idh/MocA family protein [Clostridia bacterium]
MLKFAVAGTGFARKVVLPALQRHPKTEAIGISSGHRSRAEEVAREYGVRHHTTQFSELLDLEPDAVIITTPPDLHHSMSMAALQRGIPVICEKPMALDANEAKEMCRTARENNLLAAIDFEFRYLPVRARMSQLIGEGYLGEITFISLSSFATNRANPESPWTWWSDATRGGGALGASASHFLDAFIGWAGPIEEVMGSLTTVVDSRPDHSGRMRRVDADDSYSVAIRFESGASGNMVYCSAATHGRPLEIAVYGTDGTLINYGDEVLWGGKLGKELQPLEIPDELRLLPDGSHEEEIADGYWLQPPFLRLLHDFVSGIEGGKYRGPSFEDGMNVQRALDAVRFSHSTGWIKP